jgi:PPOX class probable F420-dependent enzyme
VVEIPESHRDVADAQTMAVLGTLGPDGFPQLTALGFLYDDGVFKLCVSDARQKLKNLQRAPECSLFVFAPESQYRYLEVRGRATLVPDPDYVGAHQISSKYGSSGDHVRSLDEPGERRYVVEVTPEKVVAWGATPE